MLKSECGNLFLFLGFLIAAAAASVLFHFRFELHFQRTLLTST